MNSGNPPSYTLASARMHSASGPSMEASKNGGQARVPRVGPPVDMASLFRGDPLLVRTSTPRLDKRGVHIDIMSYYSSDEEYDDMPGTLSLEQVMKDRKTASLAAESAKRKQETESSAAPPTKNKLTMSKKDDFAVHFAAALADVEKEDPTMPHTDSLPTKAALKKSNTRTYAAAANSADAAAHAVPASAAASAAPAPAKAKTGSSFVEQTDKRNPKQYVPTLCCP